jgi:hypothetical protein
MEDMRLGNQNTEYIMNMCRKVLEAHFIPHETMDEDKK